MLALFHFRRRDAHQTLISALHPARVPSLTAAGGFHRAFVRLPRSRFRCPASRIWRPGLNRLMASTAPGHWRRRHPVEFGRVVVGLAAHRCPAFSTHVIVLTAARQNEKELSARWSRAATARAKETRRLELAEGIGPGHDWNSTHAEPHEWLVSELRARPYRASLKP